MNVELSYDKEFGELLDLLRIKYGAEIFEIEGIGSQLDLNKFSKGFFSTKTTADASIDDNSNVGDSSIISYSVELTKPYEKLNSLYLLWKEMRRLYHTDVANNIIEMYISGDIYIHDFYSINKYYCMNYSTYDLINKGLPMVHKIKCEPPKYLHSFKSQLEQFIVIASNSSVGASGTSDLLVGMSYYVKKLVDTLSDAHFKFASEDDVWTYVKETITSLVYTLNQPFRGGIQCFDEDTDILTPSGFKKYTDLNVGDLIYTWNNGSLNIQPIRRMNISEYNGDMHIYSGRDISMCVTPNHRIIHKKNNSHEYDINISADLIGRKTPLVIPITTNTYNAPEYNISDESIQLVTIVLTDGSLKLHNESRGRIQIFKSPNRYGAELIHELLNICGYEYSMSRNSQQFELSKSEDYVDIFTLDTENSNDIMKLINATKSRLPNWMFKLSRRQAQLVIQTWAQFDGHVSNARYGCMKLQCDSYEIAEQIQHLCMIAGYGSNITERLIGNNKTPTIYVIPYLRNCKSLINKEIINYNGIVWCPTTDDGVVIVRRNNSTFISGNSAFTNVSVYDKYFLEDLVDNYIFEDGSIPDIDIVNRLQDIYLDVMNETLRRTAISFPVTTACFSVDDNRQFKDEKFVKYIIEKNKEFGFINLFSGKSSVNSGCCRLRSDMESIGYSNSIGGSSTKIGSIGVTTINMYRLAKKSKDVDEFKTKLVELVGVAARVNHARRTIIRKKIERGYAPLYEWDFVSLDKQFSTCGINGFYEAMCELGIDITSDDGLKLAIEIIDVVNAENRKYDKSFGYSHNTEQVPGESLSVKIALKDKILGYNTEYELYSNQFIPLTASADILERIKIQGALDSHFSGGSILHLNFDKRIDDVDKIYNILQESVQQGVVYMAINYVLHECENGHMSVGNIECCSTCSGRFINNYTRIVGYLSNVKNWNKTRRSLDYPNRKFYNGNSL